MADKPWIKPNRWSQSKVGDFPDELHEANTAKPGVHYFEEMGMSTAKGTKILSKVAARASEQAIETATAEKHKAKQVKITPKITVKK